MKKIYEILSNVKTPLSLAGLVIIVLYMVYELILSLNVFDNVGSTGTINIINSIVDKIFLLALLALILGVSAYVISLTFGKQTTGIKTKENKAQDDKWKQLQLYSMTLSDSYAERIEKWFSSRYIAISKFTQMPDLRTNNKEKHDRILKRIHKEVDGFPGGFYTLDQTGIVLHQYTPMFPDLANIIGYKAGHKDYFVECQRQQKPIVCNSFTSADRREEILVAAWPRFNDKGEFIGIIDAVIDISSAPFSDIAIGIIHEVPSIDNKKMRLLLIDNRKMILGSDRSMRAGEFIGRDPVIEELLRLNSHDISKPSPGNGAIKSVIGTPFSTLAYWSD